MINNPALTAQLNPPQQQAVTSMAQNQLVLAGAGSGKTRVLVHRIAWLIGERQVAPYQILAVTFTNKAAREMSQRIEALLGHAPRGMWVGTFHGLAHRLLRTHWQQANLQENFQILDSDDQKRLLKRLMKEAQIDEKFLPLRDVQWFINHCKENGQRFEHLPQVYLEREHTLHHLYQLYEQVCQRNSLVDFSELLLRAHELWLHQPHILQHYQQRFQFILVDEFQDTNTIQYAWIKVLAGDHSHVMAVGDDDQSIYGWRGAKIEHIQQFEQDFTPAELIRLEQNYRSTSAILDAANAIIKHNQSRLGKTLWTENSGGEKIAYYEAFNEYDEAEYIVNRIIAYREQGMQGRDIAILYRSNAQSRLLEERLIQAAIPYRVYGGLRFFDRAEIRDALAYLRLVHNRHDDAAFERVINLPPRGIGARTLDKIRQQANARQLSLHDAARQLCQQGTIRGKAGNAIVYFCELLQNLREQQFEVSLEQLLQQIYDDTQLIAYHTREPGERGLARKDNLEELLNALAQFNPQSLVNELLPAETDMQTNNELQLFLSHALLESSESQAQEWDDCVQLMTLHSAKGLEFPCVFIAGMEDGLFPHKNSDTDPLKLEEERRLCYVGITRAMRHLHLCCAQTRSIHGKTERTRPSRFIAEMPSDCLQQVRAANTPYYQYQANASQQKANYRASSNHSPLPGLSVTPEIESTTATLRVGQKVHHKKFGSGVILKLQGEGSRQKAQVRFMQAGERWLIASVLNVYLS